MPDHFHLLIGLKPTLALSDLVQDIKSGSSGFINQQRWSNELEMLRKFNVVHDERYIFQPVE